MHAFGMTHSMCSSQISWNWNRPKVQSLLKEPIILRTASPGAVCLIRSFGWSQRAGRITAKYRSSVGLESGCYGIPSLDPMKAAVRRGARTQSQADANSVILRKQVGCLRECGGRIRPPAPVEMNNVGERGVFPAPRPVPGFGQSPSTAQLNRPQQIGCRGRRVRPCQGEENRCRECFGWSWWFGSPQAKRR